MLMDKMIARTGARIDWVNENLHSILNDYTYVDRYQAATNFVKDEAYKLALDHMGLKWPVEVACLSDTQRKKFILLQKRYEELIFRGVKTPLLFLIEHYVRVENVTYNRTEYKLY